MAKEIRYLGSNPNLKRDNIYKDCEIWAQNLIEVVAKKLNMVAQICNHQFNFTDIANSLLITVLKLTLKTSDCLTVEELKHHSVDEFLVQTYDGALLDTIEYISTKQKSLPIEQQKYFVFLQGNTLSYSQYMEEMKEYADKTGFNYIAFDYGGCGKSRESRTPDSYFEPLIDAITEIQRLKDKNVSGSNIVIVGHSMGGAIGIKAASYFHQQGYLVNIFSDRSFGDLLEVVPHEMEKMWLGSYIGYEYCLYNNIGWHLDVDNDFDLLPVTNKAHAFVLEKKSVRTIDPNHKKDHKIPHKASLHYMIHDQYMEDNRDAIIQKCIATGKVSREEMEYVISFDKMTSRPGDGINNWHNYPAILLQTAYSVYSQTPYSLADYIVEFALTATGSIPKHTLNPDELVYCNDYYPGIYGGNKEISSCNDGFI